MNGSRIGIAILALLAALLAAPAVLATNGMYLAGYGTEANGRGGANIAVADRALGLQANPAGIAQLQGNHYSLDIQFLMPDLSYGGDPFGNTIEGESNMFVMPSFSYVRGGQESDWTWGIGMISQGGMGAEFIGYNTPFGTSGDQTYSQVRFATINPTVAYNFNEDVSVGVSANIGFSDVEFRFWPDTSFYMDPGTPMDPSDDIGFFGANLTKQASTLNYSVRAGLMWRVNQVVQLGFVYQTETESDYEDGNLRLNQTALGLGPVNYDAKVEGFTWPEQYGIGAEFRPSSDWLVAVDVKRYMWEGAIELIEVSGENPDNAMTPVTMPLLPFDFSWQDQTVVAVGVEHRLNNTVTLRGGLNHGSSPVPDDTLNPLFPATPEEHATFGVSVNRGNNTFHFALEHAFEATQTNNNMNPNVNPFGPGATVDHSQWTISFGFSKAFSR